MTLNLIPFIPINVKIRNQNEDKLLSRLYPKKQRQEF